MALPRFNEKKRRDGLKQLRTEQNRYYANLTPDERLDRVEALMWLAEGRRASITSDESLELWLRIKQRLRAAARSHE